MADRRIRWTDATLKQGDLTAPIDPATDEDWRMAFGVALRQMEQETRGQVYEGWDVDENGLSLTGVLPDALKPTADFFDVVVMQANQELTRHLAERERLEGAATVDRAATEAAEQAALDQLRRRV